MPWHRIVAGWTLLLLLLLLHAGPALAFFDPPWITPESPLAGEVVSVNIRGGYCDSIFFHPDYPQITREGNAIHLLEYGHHYESGNELCVYPPGTLTEPLGIFAPGEYILTVEMAYIDFFGIPQILPIGVVSFTVVAPVAPAKPVPATNLLTLLVLVVVLPGFVWIMRRYRPALLLIVLACVPFGARAQSASDNRTIAVLLTTAPGAPTPQQVVNWCKSSPRIGKPPLQAFSVKDAQDGDYLIPDRAAGDFLAWLNANPHSVRKKLEDYVLLKFASVADVSVALAALQADPYVAEAHEPLPMEVSSASLIGFGVIGTEPSGEGQYGRDAFNIDAAWQLAGGYALVGQIDMGLYVDHPSLRQFSGTTYVGGNFVEVASRDVGLTGLPPQSGFDETDVDEAKPMWIPASPCTPNPDVPALLSPAFLGHGTHVAGLVAANGASGLGVQGTCEHCGIAMWKVAYLECRRQSTPAQVWPSFNTNGAYRAEVQTIDIGAQVLSMSYGTTSNPVVIHNCIAYQNFPECLAIAWAESRDVAMVASSGNERHEIDFPASDARVIAAGGFQQDLALWDDFPGSCPTEAPAQCGSNFSKLHGTQYLTHQELLGSAKNVLSTTYPDTTWVDYAQCGDQYGTPMGDGIGWCTGTSMSAPQIAGAVGLLRSINPLVPTSEPEPDTAVPVGIRTVLARTASRAGQGWDSRLG